MSDYKDNSTSITLISKDGDRYEISFSIAKLSTVIAEMCRNENKADIVEDENREVCLSTIKSQVLSKVIDYCRHYYEVEQMTPIEAPFKTDVIEALVQEWYADFVKVDKVLLFEMVLAANFLDIKPMLELCCVSVSRMITGRKEDEIRDAFNLSNRPFSSEQIEAVRKENDWAFEAKLKFEEDREKILEDLDDSDEKPQYKT